MKRILTIFFLLISIITKASHIVGGECYYEYVGPDASRPGYLIYNLHVKLYRECNNTTPLPSSVTFVVSSFETVPSQYIDFSHVGNMEPGYPQQISLINNNPCVTNPPTVCYEYAVYTYNGLSIPSRNLGYSVSYQSCCRVDNLTNIQYPTPPLLVGFTYPAIIPGPMSTVNNAPDNINPHFVSNDATLICSNNYFELDFGATDANGDQLVYSLCDAYNGAAAATSTPPFGVLTYQSPYSGSQPMGPNVTINPSTGKLSGIAPGVGTYVVAVCCDEYRSGIKIGTARKDFQVQVRDCSVTQAITVGNSALGDGAAVNCKSLTIQFRNISTGGNIIDYRWDFGDPSTLADTSHVFEPSYTYPAPGTYTARLTVKTSTGCTDDTTQVVRVYPLLTTGFKVAGSCLAAPFTFTDTSFTTSSGNIINRKWDFGEPSLTTDTISNVNPATYSYPSTGTKNVSLIIINSVGCTDTSRRDVIVTTKPLINPSPRDTLICFLDTVTINTNTGIPGIFSWSPNYMINSLTAVNPRVSPDVDTKYYVSFDNGAGCSNTDSVMVRVKTQADINIYNTDSSFCKGDSVQIFSSFTGTSFAWSPTSGLNPTNVGNPKASPANITQYIVTALLGSCPPARDSVTLKPVPPPQAAIINHTGSDTNVCKNATIQLIATGGSSYTWSPSAEVVPNNNDTVTVTPTSTQTYTVTVSDTLGCNKTSQAGYTVNVSQGITAFAGNDTIVLPNQVFQLHGTGGDNYSWLPPVYLSDPNIADPSLSLPESVDSIMYYLFVSDIAGCTDKDSILIHVFKGKPDILVPTAFNPNAIDPRNRSIKPLCFGIRQLNYFRVFDRLGNMVYETNTCNMGWDGTYKGSRSPMGTYLFITEGTDISGKLIRKQGYFVLLK